MKTKEKLGKAIQALQKIYFDLEHGAEIDNPRQSFSRKSSEEILKDISESVSRNNPPMKEASEKLIESLKQTSKNLNSLKMEKKITSYKLIKEYPDSPKKGTILKKDEYGQFVSRDIEIFRWEDLEKYPEFWEPKYGEEFKAGDYAVCNETSCSYAERGEVVKINEVEDNDVLHYSCVKDKNDYCQSENFRKATPEEIESYENKTTLPEIGGYQGKDSGKDISYGCYKVDKEVLKQMSYMAITSFSLEYKGDKIKVSKAQTKQLFEYINKE